MNSRMLRILAMVIAAPATLAFATDSADPQSTTILHSSPTAAEFRPMTPRERLRDYLISLVNAESIVVTAASAGIGQAENSPEEWGGGAEGYGKRFGDAYAQHFIRRTLRYGVSAALHEDNRYFASGQKGFSRRARYAIASTFLARHDNGQRYLSISRLGGAGGAAFISRLWQPPSNTTAGDGAVSFGIGMGSDVGFNVFREFWPDVKRHFRKK